MAYIVHLLSYLTLFGYLINLFGLKAVNADKIKSKLLHLFLTLGVLSHILILILILSSGIMRAETGINFSLNPFWVSMFCSMLIMFAYLLTEEGSPCHTKVFYIVSFVLLVFSILGMHFSTSGNVYVLKPLLTMHIILSILSQVGIYFVYCLNILVVILTNLLKRKSRVLGKLPSLVPTQRVLHSGEYISLLLLAASMSTGYLITDQTFGDLKYKFLFSFLFLCALGFFIFLRKSWKLSTIKVCYYSSLVWSILLTLQIAYKMEIIN